MNDKMSKWWKNSQGNLIDLEKLVQIWIDEDGIFGSTICIEEIKIEDAEDIKSIEKLQKIFHTINLALIDEPMVKGFSERRLKEEIDECIENIYLLSNKLSILNEKKD